MAMNASDIDTVGQDNGTVSIRIKRATHRRIMMASALAALDGTAPTIDDVITKALDADGVPDIETLKAIVS